MVDCKKKDMEVDKNFYDYYKKHGDSYYYHYLKLAINIHRKRYDELYGSYLWLFIHKKCKKEEYEWVMNKFVISYVMDKKDYALGNKRIKELLNVKSLPQECRETLEEWKVYLEKLGVGELTDYETYYARAKKNLCTMAEYEWGMYSFVVIPLSKKENYELCYKRIQELLAIETYPQWSMSVLVRLKSCLETVRLNGDEEMVEKINKLWENRNR